MEDPVKDTEVAKDIESVEAVRDTESLQTVNGSDTSYLLLLHCLCFLQRTIITPLGGLEVCL